MSDPNDQFFTEDDGEQAPACPEPSAIKPAPERRKGTIKPPSFAMAVVIAVVALALGLAIGYFAGMYVASNSSTLAQEHADAAAQTSVAATTDSTNE